MTRTLIASIILSAILATSTPAVMAFTPIAATRRHKQLHLLRAAEPSPGMHDIYDMHDLKENAANPPQLAAAAETQISKDSSPSSEAARMITEPASIAVLFVMAGLTSLLFAPAVVLKQGHQHFESALSTHKAGLFSPLVFAGKAVLGTEALNKVRANAISLHSNTIKGFIELSETPVGEAALKAMFDLADRNKNGVIEEQELEEALTKLGFDWIKEKQARGIFDRADEDGNGVLDWNEWRQEAPKTLRTNLIKLAKKNGGELGLLA